MAEISFTQIIGDSLNCAVKRNMFFTLLCQFIFVMGLILLVFILLAVLHPKRLVPKPSPVKYSQTQFGLDDYTEPLEKPAESNRIIKYATYYVSAVVIFALIWSQFVVIGFASIDNFTRFKEILKSVAKKFLSIFTLTLIATLIPIIIILIDPHIMLKKHFQFMYQHRSIFTEGLVFILVLFLIFWNLLIFTVPLIITYKISALKSILKAVTTFGKYFVFNLAFSLFFVGLMAFLSLIAIPSLKEIGRHSVYFFVVTVFYIGFCFIIIAWYATAIAMFIERVLKLKHIKMKDINLESRT